MLKYGGCNTFCKSKEIKEILGSFVASYFSDFSCSYPDRVLGVCSSSLTVNFTRFCSSVPVLRLVSNRSHLLQIILLELVNDRLNFVLSISA